MSKYVAVHGYARKDSKYIKPHIRPYKKRNIYTYEIKLSKYKNGLLDISKAVECTRKEFFIVFRELKLDKVKHSFWDRFF